MNDTDTVKRDGKVALRQIGNTQRSIPVDVDGIIYAASVQHNVWIVWAEEEVVETLLSRKIKGCDCGGGAYKPLYKLASVLDVSVHETGDRPH